MNKKVLFTIAPAIIALGAVTGCKGGNDPTPAKTLTSIKVTPTMTSYFVGDEFKSSDIGSFQANYSDGSTVSVKSGYTSDPSLPYTFTDADVTNGKKFTFTYEGKTDSFTVNANYRTINATYSEGKYKSADAGSFSAKTVFKGTVTYSNDDQIGFNSIYMCDNDDNKHDLKINDPSATINVIQVKKETNNEDITTNCEAKNNIITIKGAMTKENINIYFTVIEHVSNLILVAEDSGK